MITYEMIAIFKTFFLRYIYPFFFSFRHPINDQRRIHWVWARIWKKEAEKGRCPTRNVLPLSLQDCPPRALPNTRFVPPSPIVISEYGPVNIHFIIPVLNQICARVKLNGLFDLFKAFVYILTSRQILLLFQKDHFHCCAQRFPGNRLIKKQWDSMSLWETSHQISHQ